MKKRIRFYPRVHVDTADVPAVGQAGGVLLTDTVAASGLDTGLSAALAPWRKPLAVHDPGKVVVDLALALALGGDCLADVALLRAEPGVFGRVASDPTVSRCIGALAADAPAALRAIDSARAVARARVWALAGKHAPDYEADAAAPLIVDLDATLVTSHSEKEAAAPTFKRGFRFSPAVRVRRSRARRQRRAARGDAPTRERRVKHRRRSHHRDKGGARATARAQAGRPAGSRGADPHRRGRREPQIRVLAACSAPVVLDRVRATDHRPTLPNYSRRSPRTCGPPLTTVTAVSVTARGSRNSPTCST